MSPLSAFHETGWDPTPGIVSVWAEPDGRALRVAAASAEGALVREDVRFRPWLLLDRLDDLAHLGPRLVEDRRHRARGTRTADRSPGASSRGRARCATSSARTTGARLRSAVLHGAVGGLGGRSGTCASSGKAAVLALPPEEQYLVATGRTYFRDSRSTSCTGCSSISRRPGSTRRATASS